MSAAMQKLLDSVKKAKSGGGEKDETYFYYPARDAAGNGSAIIRFLPAEDPEKDSPFVKLYTHGFKGANDKWLIENCPTTLENPDIECPVCIENGLGYKSMDKDDARKRGMNRKTSYISRILVVEDKKNPENEGKVFLFKYGKTIFDKIVDRLSPEIIEGEEDDALDPCNVFDLKEGANFKFKIRVVEKQTNYDKSSFEEPSECDVPVLKQYTEENDITQFVAPDKFKSFDKLQARLDIVLGKVSPQAKAAKPTTQDDEDDTPPIVESKSESKRTVVKKPTVIDDDEEDDIMGLVRDLAKED